MTNSFHSNLRAIAASRKAVAAASGAQKIVAERPTGEITPDLPPPPKKQKVVAGDAGASGSSARAEDQDAPQGETPAPAPKQTVDRSSSAGRGERGPSQHRSPPPRSPSSRSLAPGSSTQRQQQGADEVHPRALGPSIQIPLPAEASIRDDASTSAYLQNMFTNADLNRLERLKSKYPDLGDLAGRHLLDSLLLMKGLQEQANKSRNSVAGWVDKYNKEKKWRKEAEKSASKAYLAEQGMAEKLGHLETELKNREEAFSQASELLNAEKNITAVLRNDLGLAKRAEQDYLSEIAQLKLQVEEINQLRHQEEEIAQLKLQLEEAKTLTEEAKTLAVQNYKASGDFKQDSAAYFYPTYIIGMQDYRSAVLSVYPDLDLSVPDEQYPDVLVPQKIPGEESEEASAAPDAMEVGQQEEEQPSSTLVPAQEGNQEPPPPAQEGNQEPPPSGTSAQSEAELQDPPAPVELTDLTLPAAFHED